MKKLILLSTLALCLFTSYGQDYHKIDSLKQILNTLPELNGTDADTTRIMVCINIGLQYDGSKPDSALWWHSLVADTSFSKSDIRKNTEWAKKNALAVRYIANMSFRFYNYAMAKAYFLALLKIREECGTKTQISTIHYSLGNCELYLDDLFSAYSHFEMSLKLKEELNEKQATANCLYGLGFVKQLMGDYPLAIDYFNRSIKINEELGDTSQVAGCTLMIGVCYKNDDEISTALTFYEKAMILYEKIKSTGGISICLTNLASVACELGNDSTGIAYYKRALKLFEANEDSNGIASCYVNIGNLSANPEYYYEKAISIFEKAGDSQSIFSIECLRAGTAKEKGNYQLAEKHYEKAKKIVDEVGDWGGTNAGLLSTMGTVAYKQGNYQKAIEYYEKSISEGIGTRSDFASKYRHLADVYLRVGMKEKALSFYLKSQNLNMLLIRDYFTFLSEKEKEQFITQTKLSYNCLHAYNATYPYESDSLTGICYNNELMMKSILLRSTLSVLDAVYYSEDTVIKKSFLLLKQYRNKISSLQGSRESTRDSLLTDLEYKANEQESELVKLSSEFANIQNLFNYKWEDVRKNLKPGEAAIEFVSFTQGDNNDTTVYAALLITSESKKPVSIKLFEDSQLQKIIAIYKGDDYQKISKLYGTNQNINNELYRLIWQPLEQHLTGIKNVYFAPVGVLNKISFSALGDGKQLLCDKYNLQQVSSTGKLINQEPFSLQGNLTAAVFGGIDFNLDSAAETQNLASLWQYLPGTLSEKESIQKQLQKKKVVVTGFAGKEATEPAFKSMYADKGASPDILHISTHGFFYPDPEQVKKEKTDAIERGGTAETGDVAFRGATGCATWQFVNNKNPMMRSGIALAGANRVWTQEWGRTDDEGVLTALEVSHLNMKNTDLVVLSACETGLGDIKGSEGVYGLQRAFKMAGVKYIIMSLWQVPDKETQEFMTAFYSKLLKIKNVRTAFVETQKEMRGKYDPYFWGAFVLVE